MSHQVQACVHGVIYSQCRCPSPAKSVTVVPCDWTKCNQSNELTEEQLLKEVAEMIILEHTRDIDYGIISELAWDELELNSMSAEDKDIILEKLDTLISKAKVNVTFE